MRYVTRILTSVKIQVFVMVEHVSTTKGVSAAVARQDFLADTVR